MLKPKHVVLLLLLLCSPVFAADSKPSDESIKQLLAVTETQKMVDAIKEQFDGMVKNAMQQALQGRSATPAQQQIIGRMQTRIVAILKEEMSWEALESLYLPMYRDSFTQEEVDGMLAFYKTPSGQAVIKKLPLLIQHIMAEVPKRFGPAREKIQRITQEMQEELKAQDAR